MDNDVKKHLSNKEYVKKVLKTKEGTLYITNKRILLKKKNKIKNISNLKYKEIKNIKLLLFGILLSFLGIVFSMYRLEGVFLFLSGAGFIVVALLLKKEYVIIQDNIILYNDDILKLLRK